MSSSVLTGHSRSGFTGLRTMDVQPVTIKRFPLPVTKDLPPLVVSNESVSLRDLDLARVTTWANLPRACQTLYHNIVGQGIKLKTDDFEDLPEAIHRSIKSRAIGDTRSSE
ncbi:hypothetical protein ASPTUDRAFT_200934 [Aspergillus tubingensis CBS 134.48]|uniref:Uncharacterized protein n=1 Tax=Aspergillus tubingensis (strain CBS 134.48) TaxID=767770 RepID=A0A1L9N2W9_ASPTC|nr:hypothetical protein ASPTUDRAFT_200934 [Aspergillus tubingensis CBS 134.48]